MLTQVVQRGEGKTVPFLLGDGRETKRTQENGAGMRGEERRGEERREGDSHPVAAAAADGGDEGEG